MTKARKRLVAAILAFTSIISFGPVEFGINGISAYAASNSADIAAATTVSVTEGPNGPGEITQAKEYLFTTKNIVKNIYVVVPNKTVSKNDIAAGDTGIIGQEVKIKKINGINVETDNINTGDPEDVGKVGGISDINLKIKKANLSRQNQVGLMIENLPLGVNKIEYTVKVDTLTKRIIKSTIEGIPDKIEEEQGSQEGEYPTLTIEHGNEVVQSQIHSIDFTNFVSGRLTEGQLNDDNFNVNTTPFIYKKLVETTNNKSSLRYVNSVPTSVTALDYTINILKGVFELSGETDDSKIDNSEISDIIYVNGERKTSAGFGDSDDKKYKTLKGTLTDPASSTMIVLAVRRANAIQRSFSIEINYETKKAQEDYSLREAGITKYNFNADADVKAQVGKVFVETTGTGNESGIPIYSGILKVDSRAKMIAIEPTLSRTAASTAYKIYNNYDGGSEPGQLKNGKTYVNFNKGTNNTIILEVYEGKDGSISGKMLAIYKFKVDIVGTETSDIDLSFKDNDTYLTQPGRSEKYTFSADRRSYDLYSPSNIITFNLLNPKNKNAYLKAWTSDSVKTGNLKSVDVKQDGTNFTVDVKEGKKLVLQVYYDKITYKTDENGNEVLDGKGEKQVLSKQSYPIGDKYTFYIDRNKGGEEEDNPEDTIKSSNAELSDIKVKGTAIKPSQGNTTGFSKDKNEYEATVSKNSKEANVTVSTAAKKVSDISVKVVETGDEYGIDSETGFDFPLNNNGKTTLEIVVTAEDGKTKKTYTVTINNNTKNGSAELKNIILDKGDLIFDSSKKVNTARVDLNVKKVTLTPVLESAGALVTVNGTKFTGSPVTISLAGEQKTEVKIEVTSEDGNESKSYKVEIYRSDSVIEDIIGGNNDSTSDIFYDDVNECWVDISKYDEWGKVNGKSVYFDKKGRQVKNSWIKTDDKYYFLNSNGYKASGWKVETDGKKYYLDPTTGEMKTGWISVNNKVYYLAKNGAMKKGWLNENGKWYYFSQNGDMIVNTSMYIDGEMCKFGKDGAKI